MVCPNYIGSLVYLSNKQNNRKWNPGHCKWNKKEIKEKEQDI